MVLGRAQMLPVCILAHAQHMCVTQGAGTRFSTANEQGLLAKVKCVCTRSNCREDVRDLVIFPAVCDMMTRFGSIVYVKWCTGTPRASAKLVKSWKRSS